VERQINDLGNSRYEVRISLTKNELQPHYNQVYNEAQQGIALDGFRKGKVPLNIIKQKFGRQIEADALESIADTEFKSFATADKIKVVGNPGLTDVQKDADGSVTFTIRYDVMPEFELQSYRGITVNRPVRPITDEDVQNEIDRLCLRAASFEPAEKVVDAMHIATLSMRDLDKETGMPILGKEGREVKVFVDDENVDMHLRNSLNDKSVGDTFTYVAETEDENAVPPSYHVTVTDIQKVVPAEFTNEFAELVSQGRFKTTEEVRDDIRHQLEHYVEDASREAMENQIVDHLVKAHTIDVPHSLVHAVVHQLADDFKRRNENVPDIQKMTAHDLEPQLLPTAERIVRWELIRERIIETEKIELTDEDLSTAATRYGLDADQLRMLLRQNHSVGDQLLAEKAMQILIDYAIINDVGVADEEPVA
jgi:trigger factor